MPVVSIVIPTYNCSHTIKRCLDSLLNQTYDDFEIIIADDGSTDSTLDICKSIAAEHGNISIYELSHRGVSDTRNFALKRSRSEYVMFVDGDDYVRETYVEHMLKGMETDPDCDMCICGYTRVVYGDIYPLKSLQKSGVITRDQYLSATMSDPGHHYFGVLWNKIFRRCIIENNNIWFDEHISLGEDFVFSLNYLKYIKKVNVLSERLYYYCYQTRDSLSRIESQSLASCRAEMANRNLIFDTYVYVMKETGLYSSAEKKIYHYWITFYIRQKYSLSVEYKWDEKDKEEWDSEIKKNESIEQALLIHGKIRVALEMADYFVTQSFKNLVKDLIKFFRGGSKGE